ncbi:vWA-like protein [Neoconidiobolus thromboides FSU 785]|nr:vWA-like protein [Neoconidiobolus thromboides FSU 785]
MESCSLIGKEIVKKDLSLLKNENNTIYSYYDVFLNNENLKNKMELNLTIEPFKLKAPITLDLLLKCTVCGSYPHNKSQLSNDITLWSCCLCGNSNQIPPSFQSQFQQDFSRIQSNSTIDYIISNKNERKLNEVPNILFIIDISFNSIKNGTLSSVIIILLELIQLIPNNLNLGFITFDTHLQFYQFKKNQMYQMLVLSNLEEEPYLPLPISELCVNGREYFNEITRFLMDLELLFENNNDFQSCAGDTLFLLTELEHYFFGSIYLFLSCMPNKGKGTLITKGGTSLLGTDNEYKLLVEENMYYKDISLKLSEMSISTNLFILGNEDFDLQSLVVLSKITNGELYYYPNYIMKDFNENCYQQFYVDLLTCFKNQMGYAASLQVNLPTGLQGHEFLGKLFMKSINSCNLNTIHQNQLIQYQFQINDTIYVIKEEENSQGLICFQANLTYLDLEGNLICKVMNLSMKMTNVIEEFIMSINPLRYIQLLAFKANSNLIHQKIKITRDTMINQVKNILKLYYQQINIQNNPHLLEEFIVPSNLITMPYLIHCLCKIPCFTIGSHTTPNERSWLNLKLISFDSIELMNFIIPNIYQFQFQNEQVQLISIMPSSMNIVTNKILMMISFNRIYFWVGENCLKEELSYLFGLSEYYKIGNIQDWNDIINLKEIIKTQLEIKEFSSFDIIIETKVTNFNNQQLKVKFLNQLHEDRNINGNSYQQFLLALVQSLKLELNIN